MKRKSKADDIKRMAQKIKNRSVIAERIGVSKAYVTQVLSGKQERMRSAETRHHITTTYKPKRPIHGSCVRTIIVDGQPQICGQPCKKQYCTEHADTTRPIAVRWGVKAGGLL